MSDNFPEKKNHIYIYTPTHIYILYIDTYTARVNCVYIYTYIHTYTDTPQESMRLID